MSGRKFFLLLRYLHCCSMNNEPTGEAYDPAYKIAEIRDYLEERYTCLLTPGQQLSLDETLIRAFGRMKFKVRIVTKAARYGIKIYVITDSVTAFVLRVLIYKGRSTYGAVEDQEERLKTVQVVNHLVQPFMGTCCTIYVDRFYTSLELLKSLEGKKLYVTGTMLSTIWFNHSWELSYYLCGSFLHLIGVAQVVGRKKTLCNWDHAGESNSTGNPDCKDIPCLPPNFKRRCNQMQS
jgi:hypothetical protein